MLENSKKRARKSKLEVREGAELEEASFSYMEFPKYVEKKEKEQLIDVVTETVSQKHIIKAPEDQDPFKNVATTSNTPKMEFSVKIEVEECDEEAVPNGKKVSTPSNKNKRRIVISLDKPLSKVFQATKSNDAIQPSSSTARCPPDTTDEFKEYVTNRPMLLRIVQILLRSKNPADKYLAMVVRNYIGRALDARQMELKQRLLQLVLEDWMVWYQSHSAVRESPLLYKCYICGKSWWYLSELIDHIPQHLNQLLKFQLSIEMDNDECSLVCYQHDEEQVKVEYPETECYRCGRKADSHYFATKKPYNCTACDTTFSTCAQLTMHEGVCLAYKNENFSNITDSEQTNCSICLLECYTEERLNKHLVNRHTVRSDVVTMWELTQCTICLDYYVNIIFHTCVKKSYNYGCNFCMRSFQKKILKEIHMENNNKPTSCRICGKELTARCMEPSHMLLHTDKFALMYKCIECLAGRYYQDEFSIIHHTKIVHNRPFVKKFKYLEMVIFPKQSLELTKKYKVYKITEKQENVTETPPIEPPHIPEPVANVEPDNLVDVIVKEEPIDIYMDTSQTLTMEDICVKTEKVEHEPGIQISDVTSLQGEVTLKQVGGDEDVMLVERHTDVVSVCSSEHSDSEHSGSEHTSRKTNKKNGRKKKKPYGLAKYMCKCGFKAVHKVMKGHKLNCPVMRKRRTRWTRRLGSESPSEYEFEELGASSNEEGNEDWLPNVIVLKTAEGKRQHRVYECKCKQFSGRMRGYKQHQATCSISKVFKCTKCDESYPSFSSYVCHFAARHGRDEHACPQCARACGGAARLAAHVTSHVKRQFVRLRVIEDGLQRVHGDTCRACQLMVERRDFFVHWESHLVLKNADQKVDIKEKREITSSPVSLYSPEVMKKGLESLQSSEATRPDGRPLRACTFCERSFARQNDCKRHIVEHLLADAYTRKAALGVLQCQLCAKGFEKAERYKHHMRGHGSLPIYQCNICTKSFSDSSNFCKHKKVHNLASLNCRICQKKFHHQATYDKHMEMHETTKPIVCDICSRISFTQSAHRKHVRVAHDKTRSQFTCPICRQRFRRLREKWDHMWLVHKERKVLADCPLCSKSFRRYMDVRGHCRDEHGCDLKMSPDGVPQVVGD